MSLWTHINCNYCVLCQKYIIPLKIKRNYLENFGFKPNAYFNPPPSSSAVWNNAKTHKRICMKFGIE